MPNCCEYCFPSSPRYTRKHVRQTQHACFESKVLLPLPLPPPPPVSTLASWPSQRTHPKLSASTGGWARCWTDRCATLLARLRRYGAPSPMLLLPQLLQQLISPPDTRAPCSVCLLERLRVKQGSHCGSRNIGSLNHQAVICRARRSKS